MEIFFSAVFEKEQWRIVLAFFRILPFTSYDDVIRRGNTFT